jgi:hypothetical protein
MTNCPTAANLSSLVLRATQLLADDAQPFADPHSANTFEHWLDFA